MAENGEPDSKKMRADGSILPGIGSPISKLPKIPKIPKLSSPDKVRVKQEMSSPEKSPMKSPTSPMKNGLSTHVKKEESDDEDTPLTERLAQSKKVKKEEEDSDEDVPLTERLEKVKKEKDSPGKKRKHEDDENEEDFKPHKDKKKHKKEKKEKRDREKKEKKVKQEQSEEKPKKKKKEEEEEVWRWWEEESLPDGVKWKTLCHNGPCFPDEYERLPSNVRFFYDGKPMVLSDGAEEVATFYGRMIDHDYTKKDVFNDNFWEDWRKEMTSDERDKIKSLSKCNFSEINDYFKQKSEERKAMSKEEKNKIKEKNAAIAEHYGTCTMDGHKQKVGNFRVEPPGLFRGRGDHPKQGKLKKRLRPEEIIINIGKGEKVPDPPSGHKWKAVQHDNTVTWLACWIENIAGQYKYVMLNAATRIKGEKDWQKYEKARALKSCVDKIRKSYEADWKSKEMRVRQRSVALYFIDKLALRAGHEKEEGETADTVGCCSLRFEHITLHEEDEGKDYVVEFDFLGKDSMRYLNKVPVEKRVFKNLKLFMDGKQAGDDLFDRLSTTSLNKHLSEQMEGLTAKVFRTYNASNTLQDQLKLLTNPDDPVTGKILSYNRANRAVAVLCNHQRAPPKTFDKQMENLVNKLKDKKKSIKDVKKEIKRLKHEYHENGKSESVKNNIDKKKKQMARLEEQYFKLEVSMTDKEENKEIALGTSKLNYLDPRISIAWCKKHEVPIEKIYNKTQRQKFQWAIDMTEEDFEF